MPNRSDEIFNSVTALTTAFEFRDILILELASAGWDDFDQDVIFSQFKPEHFHNMDLCADLIAAAIPSMPSTVYSMFRSANTRLDLAQVINTTRERFDGAGNFTSSTGWTFEGGWSYDSIEDNADGNVLDGNFENIIWNETFEVGAYLFTFDITGYTSGSVATRFFSDNEDGTVFNSAGSHSDILGTGAGGATSVAIGVNAAGGFIGRVDNFKLRRVI